MRTGHTSGVDLRLLNTFRVVAETGSVTAASTVLLTGQPALSRQLQQLERETGAALFARTGGRLRLTAAGRTFLEAAIEVLDRAAAATSLAEALAAGRLTRVHMAAPTTTLTDVLAPFLATLRPEDPLATVEEAHFTDAVDALGTRVDLTILTAPPPHHLSSRQVAVLPVWAYVNAAHPLAGDSEIPVERLVGDRLILLDSTFRPRVVVDEALIEAGLSAPEIVECHNPQVAQALAAAGRGIAVVSDDPRFDLVPLRIRARHGLLMLTLYAAWDPRHHAAAELDRLAVRLRRFCVDRYGASVAG
jgi:DNA-binding transcriptional LysR family regulator